jgi:hypothetical protein
MSNETDNPFQKEAEFREWLKRPEIRQELFPEPKADSQGVQISSKWNRTGANSNRRKPGISNPGLRIHQHALGIARSVPRWRSVRRHRQPANSPGPVNPGQPRSTQVNPKKFSSKLISRIVGLGPPIQNAPSPAATKLLVVTARAGLFNFRGCKKRL